MAMTGAIASARGGGGGGGPAPAPRLPADFPADVPLPAGSLQGSTGSAGQWTVVLLVTGLARDVQRSTVRFYVAAGYSADSDAIVHKGSRKITILAAARDHSPTETNLTLAVIDANPAAAGPRLVATILPANRHVRLATARRSGLRVRFTAPPAARSAIVRAYHTIDGAHKLIATRTTTVHPGTNTVALNTAAIRHAIKPGIYTLKAILHGTGATHGPPATTTVRVTP